MRHIYLFCLGTYNMMEIYKTCFNIVFLLILKNNINNSFILSLVEIRFKNCQIN